MAKDVDRELRKELLFKALEKFSELDQAFDAVIRMERFILDGISSANTQESVASRELTETDSPQLSAVQQVVEVDAPETRRSGPRRRWREDDDSRLRELCAQGYTVKEIAEELERTPASIYGRMTQRGLSVIARPQSEPQRAPARNLKIVKGTMAEFGNGNLSDQATSEEQIEIAESQETKADGVAIDEVVHFLRTRDYSIVSTEDGRYKVDGRQIMTAQELLQRANRVRESLGQSSWKALHEVPAIEKPTARRNGPGWKRKQQIKDR